MDLKIKENMEKTIKMSLETAQTAYKLICQEKDPISAASQMMSKILNENFTKEELEGKKGFTWEDSFDQDQVVWDYAPALGRIMGSTHNHMKNKNFLINKFKTEAQAKSALAFAQLSHIVAKYNEEKNGRLPHIV